MYIVFCTSRHLTVGTFAIISIMILATITRLENKYFDIEMSKLNGTLNHDDTTISQNVTVIDLNMHDIRLKIATSLSFWCGIIQVPINVTILYS